MILDSLTRFRDYLGVHPLFTGVAEYPDATNLAALPEARHEVGTQGCFALVSRYRTLAPGEGFIECHRRHLDIQIGVKVPLLRRARRDGGGSGWERVMTHAWQKPATTRRRS